MPQTYPDFVAFIEGLVLPMSQEHSDWTRLDGRRAGEPSPSTRAKRAAVVVDGDQKYAVDDDAVIENLLALYHAWKARQVDYPVVVGWTRNKRPMLVPAPGAGVKTGFFVYWQGARKGGSQPLITVTIELPPGRDLWTRRDLRTHHGGQPAGKAGRSVPHEDHEAMGREVRSHGMPGRGRHGRRPH